MKTKLKPKNIALRVREMADAYALETLYHEMKPFFPNDNIYFSVKNRAHNNTKDVAERYPYIAHGDYSLHHSKPNLVVQVMSDTTEDLSRYELGPCRTLVIDAALLKAMRKLPSPKQLKKIKKEYNLDKEQRPIAVMGWIPYKEGKRAAKKLILSLIPDVRFVATPDRNGYPTLKYMKLKEDELAHITEIEGTGHLSKLHAISDISFSGYNARKHGGRLNNFYEQSQGSPFFLAPTANTKQYGYKNLVEQEIVRPCKNIEDIIEQSTTFLKQLKANPEIKKQHRKKWLAHRNKTRHEFLPKIFDRINWILNSGNKKEIFTYVHPESDWDGIYLGKNPVDIFGDDYKDKIGREGK